MMGQALQQKSCDCVHTPLKVGRGKKPNAKKKRREQLISWLAGISLVLAYGYGYFYSKIDYASLIQETSNAESIALIKKDQYKLSSSDAESYYVGLGEQSGYGGPLVTSTQVNEQGEIVKVDLIADKETFSFVQKLINKGFFKQFEGKQVQDPLLLGEDINAITGATISSEAITKAVHQSSHQLGRDQFGLTIEEATQAWEINLKDYAALFILVLAIVAINVKKKWLRYVSLGVSMVLIGFYFNAAVNVSQFGRVLLGYFPMLKSNLFWYLLVGGSIAYAFFFKKNLYCQAMCPFHAVETVLVKIGGMKLTFPTKVAKIAKHSAKFLLWLSLMMIFLSQNPAIGSYEPFAMIFGLEGSGVQWYILPAVMIGVLLITDYFCRYFCPVGRGFGYIIKFRKWLDSLWAGRTSTKIKKVKI